MKRLLIILLLFSAIFLLPFIAKTGMLDYGVSGIPADNEAAVWTSSSDIEGLNEAEFKTMFNMEAEVDFAKYVVANTTHYVGKHGNDSNDGLTWASAELTFGAAITAASSGDTVISMDSGVYTENITAKSGVDIFAPNATIVGAHTIMTDQEWTFGIATVATDTIGFTMNTASEHAHIHITHLNIAAYTGSLTAGIISLAGHLMIDIDHMEVGANSYGVGSTTTDEVDLQCNEIVLAGGATAVGSAASGDINVICGSITDGAASGTLVFATDVASHITFLVAEIDVTILSNIGATPTVSILVAELDGTLTESGAGTVIRMTGPLSSSLEALDLTVGDMIYAASATALAKLDSGAQGTLLMGNAAAAPSWLAAGTSGYMLVAAGANDPAWTASTGSGAPVRANTPTLITPELGAATFATSLTANDAAGPQILNEAASSINPTLIPDKADQDSGIGLALSDALAVVAGGVEAQRWAEALRTIEENKTLCQDNSGVELKFDGVHGLLVGDVIQVADGTGGLCDNLAASTNYYVLAVGTTTTVTISATRGGSIVTYGSTGSAFSSYEMEITTNIYGEFVRGSASLNEAELEILDGATASTTQLNYLSSATGTTGTTSTNVVFSTSPTLVSPELGAATFATSLTGTNAAGPQILNEAATSINPTLIPDKTDVDSGIGWAAADTPTVVAGGVEAQRWAETSREIETTASVCQDNSGLELKTVAVHGLLVGDVVQFSGGVLCDNLSASTNYYVLAVGTTTTATLSATRGGGIIGYVNTGTAFNSYEMEITTNIYGEFVRGSASLSEAELEILDGATTTTARLNYLTSATGTTGTTSTNLVFSTSPTLVTPFLGTPQSGTMTNVTGLPVSSGISGLGSGIATFLATPSSSNFASAVTGEQGSGAVVFDTSPTITTPTISGEMNTDAIRATNIITGLVNSTILTTAEGTHDTGESAATLVDSGESWTTSAYVGMTLYNITDGSSCVVTANDGTTMTCTLTGGTDNHWDTTNVWAVAPGPKQSGSIFYINAATTILHPNTAGYMVTYYSVGANIVKVDPQSGSMQFTLDGAPTGTNGEELDSNGGAGDVIEIHNQSETIGVTINNVGPWVDGESS